MNSLRETVDYYIRMFRSGSENEAFHGLIESDPEVVLELASVYDGDTGAELRDFILSVVSEFRSPAALAFLKQELFSAEPEIWRRALDGLCLCETSASIEMMTQAAKVADPAKKRLIIEAIRDTTLAIKGRMGNDAGPVRVD